MAISEKSVVDGTLLAVEEINQKGGLLGRPVEAVVVDGRSDPATFAREAERLIAEEKVCTVFGCWTSASRRTVKPVFEKHDHLLIYPVQYEGLEASPNIVYTGAAPNQQIIPAVKWACAFLHKPRRFFLVGSDLRVPAHGQRHHPRRTGGAGRRGRRRGIPAAGQPGRRRRGAEGRRGQAGRDPEHHQTGTATWPSSGRCGRRA
jgi:hypothetical protein